MTKEMRNTIETMYEACGYDCEHFCENCPYADRCGTEELFWGCGVWEDQMGEDL